MRHVMLKGAAALFAATLGVNVLAEDGQRSHDATDAGIDASADVSVDAQAAPSTQPTYETRDNLTGDTDRATMDSSDDVRLEDQGVGAAADADMSTDADIDANADLDTPTAEGTIDMDADSTAGGAGVGAAGEVDIDADRNIDQSDVSVDADMNTDADLNTDADVDADIDARTAAERERGATTQPALNPDTDVSGEGGASMGDNPNDTAPADSTYEGGAQDTASDNQP